MRTSYRIFEKELPFKRPAVTSRNIFESRTFRLIQLEDHSTGRTGLGEATPLAKLSIDDRSEHASKLKESAAALCEGTPLEELDLTAYPSIRFGLESALIDLNANGPAFFKTPFTDGTGRIQINGLVWMNEPEHMLQEALEKAEAGFECIKFKVGAGDFDAECRMIEHLRKRYDRQRIEIRLDANGAFHPTEAPEQLRELSRFGIHSIEQPIAPGQWDDMARLCREAALPIALDEELIGQDVRASETLLKTLKPQYIILKPNLIGGLTVSDQWIRSARKLEIAWWATSALESNIGLNFIAQWVSQYSLHLPQGLGTGSLYTENFPAPLRLDGQWMRFDPLVTN